MNFEKRRAATDVLTTFKKIEDDETEISKAKNPKLNNDENFENLNKIFGNLSTRKHGSVAILDQMISSDKKAQTEGLHSY